MSPARRDLRRRIVSSTEGTRPSELTPPPYAHSSSSAAVAEQSFTQTAQHDTQPRARTADDVIAETHVSMRAAKSAQAVRCLKTAGGPDSTAAAGEEPSIAKAPQPTQPDAMRRDDTLAEPTSSATPAARNSATPGVSDAMKSRLKLQQPRVATLGGGETILRNNFGVPPVEPTTAKLAAGLGSWADETVAVGRLVDEDSRRMADARAGEVRKEGEIRRALERGMGSAVKSLPLSFLKDFGYLEEAQKRGLDKATKIIERMAAVAQLRAWKK